MKKLPLSFFTNEMGKLVAQYGEKQFSQRKQDLIYFALQHLDEKGCAAVIDELLAEYSRFPKISEIKILANKYSHQVKKVECPDCSNSGFRMLYEKKTGIGKAFGCGCSYTPNLKGLELYKNADTTEFTRFSAPRIDLSGESNVYEGCDFGKSFVASASAKLYQAKRIEK